METIEQKAQQYAEAAFAKALKAPWNEAKQAFAEAYLAGAAEALAGQWRAPEELEKYECDRFYTKILIKYRTKYQGSWLTITSINEVNQWTDDVAEYHKNDMLITWMPIPSLPKTNKQWKK